MKPLRGVRLSPPMAMALMVFAACLVSVALLRFLYLPMWGMIRARSSLARDLKVKLADAPVLEQRLARAEAALETSLARTRAFHERLGQGQSVARVLDVLQEKATRYALKFSAVQPRVNALEAQRLHVLMPEWKLHEFPLTVQLTGSYRAIGEWLGSLRDASLLATAHRLTVIPTADGAKALQADVDLGVYLMPEETS